MSESVLGGLVLDGSGWLIRESFYGFPSHYYKEKYPHVGSREIAEQVLHALRDAGIKAEGVTRGLDHGVWASFKCGTSSTSQPCIASSKHRKDGVGLIVLTRNISIQPHHQPPHHPHRPSLPLQHRRSRPTLPSRPSPRAPPPG